MKSGRPVIYWDTCVFIAWLKDEQAKWPPVVWQGIQDVADLVNIGQAILVTSTLIRTEVFLGSLTLETKQKFAGILRRKNVQEVAPDMRITDRASTIREKYKIKTPDAIHLATAIIYDVDEMHTMDDGLLARNGDVAGYNLWITRPYQRTTPSTPLPAPSEALEVGQESLWKDIVEEDLESQGDEENGDNEENHEREADPAHPPAVPGSDSGRAQGEAAGEAAKEPHKEKG